jgi:hypothetical protein
VVAINTLTKEVVKLRKTIGMRTPGLVYVKMISEGINGMSKFALVLPESGAADTAAREVIFSVNGGDPITQNLVGTATASEEFDGEQGQFVTGTLVDIDDATPTPNRSEPRTFELELVDTIAPPQPGEVGVRMISE